MRLYEKIRFGFAMAGSLQTIYVGGGVAFIFYPKHGAGIWPSTWTKLNSCHSQCMNLTLALLLSAAVAGGCQTGTAF